MGVGIWYGPNEACHMITKCLEESPLDSITAVLSADGIVYRDQIVAKCETDNGWRSLLLLLPLRLGLQKVNEKYIPALMTCFRMTHSVGFVGGKPQRSLYFVGDQDGKLLYLDPHVVRPAPSLTQDFSKDSETFHCHEVNSMPIAELDPSLALGFHCKTRADFE